MAMISAAATPTSPNKTLIFVDLFIRSYQLSKKGSQYESLFIKTVVSSQLRFS